MSTYTKVTACIICFHPDTALLNATLDAIRPFVKHVYIWKNSPIHPDLFPDKHKLSFLGDGTNHLIAHALNQCLVQSKSDGYEYLLTMDQDSVFENFEHFLKLAESYRDETIIAYTPNINNTHPQKNNEESIPVDYSFTSGSLCSVNACLSIGGFREDYGIDWVDAEFCHRAKLNGYSMVCFPSCQLKHQLGGNYGPFRYYHIFRNMLWMHKEYPENPSIKTLLHTYRYNLKSIWKSKNKIGNLLAVIRGSFTGILQTPHKKLIK